MKFLNNQDKNARPRRAKSHIPFRLNFLFFIVFILFAALIAQLGYLQVLFGDKFEAEVDRTDKTVISGNVPRGMILDSKGRVLVGNKANSAVTYTRSVSVLSPKLYEVANNLQHFITVSTDGLQPRDLADYYLADAAHLAKVNKALPASQTQDAHGDALATKVVYQNQVEYVMKQDFKYTKTQKQAAAIFKTMSSASQLTTVFVKNSGLTEKEIAEVSEHLTSLPGINIGTDWERSYPNGDSMRSIIGSVSTEKQGLPRDELSALLAQGYSRNDRVGTSYLEKQYETVLKGAKSETEVEVDSNNDITSQSSIFSGAKGNNLNLTIDSAYQKKVEAALAKTFASAKAAGYTKYADGAYAVAMNPKTGAILAMAGQQQDRTTGKITDDALGVINRTFVMGSAVKGATVMGGLMDGVITPTNNTQADTAIYLPATPVKKSVYPLGTFSSLDAVSALEVSSNIYMMHLALKEGKAVYTPNKYIKINADVFDKLRNPFAQFGLGVRTGIDLPGEGSAQIGATTNADGSVKSGQALDLSYGNYDAYTLMQMGQYVSTLANGGYRMQPYIVQSIQKTNSNGTSGPIVSTTTPKILNKVNASADDFALVKKGFYAVVHGTNAWGTAHTLADITPAVAAKTGTAQSFARVDPLDNTSTQVETITSSFVGYAPADNPTIAVAIVFPNLYPTTVEGHYNLEMAREMFTDYFKMYGTTE